MSAIFVTGAVGVGKSTALRRVIDSCAPSRKIYGFCTKKVALNGETGKIYIYPACEELICDDKHCVADMMERHRFDIHTDVFDTLGAELLSNIPDGSVVMMDELGFLESTAPNFCEKVLEIISGDYLVLGAIKPMDIPFLNAVREHPKTRLFEITEHNRNCAAEDVISEFRKNLN